MAEGFLMERIVVTGASSGIGRELSVQLAQPGREFWLIGRDTVRLAEVAAIVRGKGATAETVELDLGDLGAAGDFLSRNFPESKGVDWVYLCAAITAFGEVKDTLIGDWERLYRLNLLSPVQLARHFYANMAGKRRGHIVLISSLAAYAGYPTATAYATMKAGLLGLYRSLYHEGASHGIRIHHVSLGYVGTGIYKSAIYRNTTYEKTMEGIRRLGFGFLSAEEAARKIISEAAKGKSEFAVPAYATAMKWVAPRMPFLIGIIHRRIMRIFRQLA
ncbi:SDR family NAD(P)-dependent oxidoreductase [Akkermansiaceae bacterium]|nr:SDR family NAD(P)-dependent oxidoreductase [Akkermansiaceae bacterium]